MYVPLHGGLTPAKNYERHEPSPDFGSFIRIMSMGDDVGRGGLAVRRRKCAFAVIPFVVGLLLGVPKAAQALPFAFEFENIVDTNTLIPGGIGPFLGFSLPSDDAFFFDETMAVFVGLGSSGQKGIYLFTHDDGSLSKVIAVGDSLGSTVLDLQLLEVYHDSPVSISFFADFGPGGSSGIFNAIGTPIPEPSTLLLLASGLVGMGALTRRRSRPKGA